MPNPTSSCFSLFTLDVVLSQVLWLGDFKFWTLFCLWSDRLVLVLWDTFIVDTIFVLQLDCTWVYSWSVLVVVFILKCITWSLNWIKFWLVLMFSRNSCYRIVILGFLFMAMLVKIKIGFSFSCWSSITYVLVHSISIFFCRYIRLCAWC